MMKTSDQIANEGGVLTIMVIVGFGCPLLWIIALMMYLGGYGRAGRDPCHKDS